MDNKEPTTLAEAEEHLYYAIKQLKRKQGGDPELTLAISAAMRAHKYIKQILRSGPRSRLFSAGMIMANVAQLGNDCTRDLMWATDITAAKFTDAEILDALEESIKVLQEVYGSGRGKDNAGGK